MSPVCPSPVDQEIVVVPKPGPDGTGFGVAVITGAGAFAGECSWVWARAGPELQTTSAARASAILMFIFTILSESIYDITSSSTESFLP
jgi:hypothetical protein